MKNKFFSSFVILTLILCGASVFSLHAQTTEEGAGPSEQPSAPMEMGQQYPQPNHPPPPGQRPPAGQQPPNGQPMPDAQPNGPSGEAPAQTNQGVGRISMIKGDVSTQRGDSGDWSAAILNQPLLTGDKISTGPNARAEVQLDFANILRLSSSAQANIANFSKDHIQIHLGQGLANYSVFNESEAEPEIDTPNVAVHPAHKDVILRIEVRPDGDSVIIVRKGDAQISTPKGIADLKAGDMATVHGSLEEAQYKISPAPDRDDWDTWNSERDRMIHTARAWQHTNRYYTGSEDLDANGRWENVPDYGQIWVPNEPDGWAPYRDGNWVWEPYYGWTWVGYEPWGWAPYHYGRWMWYGGAWGWWPGPVWGAGFYRPFWAPAYVSFFGFGGGFGFGFGWGGFGWLPLGPCDWFHPWWGGYGGRFGYVGFGGYGYGRFGGFAPLHGGVLYSNVAHINDAHISAGASTVAANRFGAGHTTAVAATHAQLSSAHMMTGNMPVMPSHASLSASGRAAAPSTIHSTSSQHFAGSQSTSRPESFQQQTSHLQSAMQQNNVSSVTAGARGSAAMESQAAASRGSESRGAASGSSHSTAGGAASSTSRGGWSSFSQSSHSSASESRGTSSNSASSARGESGSYWSRTSPSSSTSRSSSYGSNDERGSSYSRPQLNMRQPIAQPRSSGSYGGASHGAPSYGGAHSSGGGHSGGGGHH